MLKSEVSTKNNSDLWGVDINRSVIVYYCLD